MEADDEEAKRMAEELLNQAAAEIASVYAQYAPESDDNEVHFSLGISRRVKAYIEAVLPSTRAAHFGRVAASLSLEPGTGIPSGASYVVSNITQRRLDETSAPVATSSSSRYLDMLPYHTPVPPRAFVRTTLYRESLTPTNNNLLMELFVTLSDVRGFLLVPFTDRMEERWVHNLRQGKPPPEATSELVLAHSISFLPDGEKWMAEISPTTVWGEHIDQLVVWAIPQSLSVDPYPIGCVANPSSFSSPSSTPLKTTIRIQFENIADAAWEQATYMVVDREGIQRYATLLQLTSQIQLARVSEAIANQQKPEVDPYFTGRADTMMVTLLVRRLVWFVSLGLDVKTYASRPNSELVLSNEWLAQTIAPHIDIFAQWRQYKCSLITQLTNAQLAVWSENPSLYVSFTPPNGLDPTAQKALEDNYQQWNSFLRRVVSPFQLNLMVYTQVFFTPKKDESAAFAERAYFWDALRRSLSRWCIWSDVNDTNLLSGMVLLDKQIINAVDSTDLHLPGAPPYVRELDATSSFFERCIQLQKRYLSNFVDQVNLKKLILRTPYNPQTGMRTTVQRDLRFATDWSTLYEELNPPAISPLIVRRYKSATPSSSSSDLAGASAATALAYQTAYKRQEGLLVDLRYTNSTGHVDPERPALYAPERHPNPRMRLLNTYVRYLWFQRRKDYLDNVVDEATPTRSWTDFMEKINRELPHLRALHLLALNMREEDRFFEMVQDVLFQSTPIERIKSEEDASKALDAYDLADPYKRLLRWLVKTTPDTADDAPLEPLSQKEWTQLLLGTYKANPADREPIIIYTKDKLEYNRPKLPMTLAATEKDQLHRHNTLDEAVSVFVQSPSKAFVTGGERPRSVNRNPTQMKTISSGLNRVRMSTRKYLSTVSGYDIPSMGLAMEDALIYKKTPTSHIWMVDENFKVEKSALSWAGQNRLTELALIKYKSMYVDDTIDNQLPWQWDGVCIRRATIHGFRHFLAHHYLPSTALIDSAILRNVDYQASDTDVPEDENKQVEYMNTTLAQLAKASLVYGGFRAPNIMQVLLQDVTRLAIMWFQNIDEVRSFCQDALGCEALTDSRIDMVGAEQEEDVAQILQRCGRDIVLMRVDDGTLHPLINFCVALTDEFFAMDTTIDDALKDAVKNGLLMDMMSGASLDSIHAMHMLETITFRHRPSMFHPPTAEERAKKCAWIGAAPPERPGNDVMDVTPRPLNETTVSPLEMKAQKGKNKKEKKTTKRQAKKRGRDDSDEDDDEEDDEKERKEQGDEVPDIGAPNISYSPQVETLEKPAKRQRTDDIVSPPQEEFMALHTAASQMPIGRNESAAFKNMQANIQVSIDNNANRGRVRHQDPSSSSSAMGFGGFDDNNNYYYYDDTTNSLVTNRREAKGYSSPSSSSSGPIGAFEELPRIRVPSTYALSFEDLVSQVNTYNSIQRSTRPRENQGGQKRDQKRQ